MKISFEYGSHKDNHENYIGILPFISVGKLDSKYYFITFEWLLWYMVLYVKSKEKKEI